MDQPKVYISKIWEYKTSNGKNEGSYIKPWDSRRDWYYLSKVNKIRDILKTKAPVWWDKESKTPNFLSSEWYGKMFGNRTHEDGKQPLEIQSMPPSDWGENPTLVNVK
jgi:hypothetical protein